MYKKPLFQYIPIPVLKQAVEQQTITQSEAYALKKEDIIRFYNRKLMSHLKYQQWPEFFYTYHSSSDLGHGQNVISHILAAHAYIMAYQNKEKAFSILDSLPESPGVLLTKSILELYLLLYSKNIPPQSPDWAMIAGMCTAAAENTTSQNKWEIILGSSRHPWYYELRPWRYPDHAADERYKHRGPF